MSIKETKIPKLLFIKGTFKKDCINDDIFDKKIIENSSIDNNISNEMEIELINGITLVLFIVKLLLLLLVLVVVLVLVEIK